jgi:predicted translin family RNA/ssDNA-binding protein
MQEFMREEKIMEQYPLVCEKFKSLESDTTMESFIESLSITKADVASGTAEIVTDLITLSDYAKLGGDMARVESLIPIMEGLMKLLRDFPTTRKDYWGLELLSDWLSRLSELPVDAVLGADQARRLETDVNRLLDDFKRRLREI